MVYTSVGLILVHPEYGMIDVLIAGCRWVYGLRTVPRKQRSTKCFLCLSPYIFSEWHNVPLLYIQTKLSRACSRKALAECKASRRLGKYIRGFGGFCKSPAINSYNPHLKFQFVIEDASQAIYKLCTNCLGDICILRLNTLRKFLMSPKPHISATLTTLVWPSLNACTALYTL